MRKPQIHMVLESECAIMQGEEEEDVMLSVRL